jgi:NAD(P)-dependent dehydrogenase (short-subunit alcohol dehydrogenase family)
VNGKLAIVIGASAGIGRSYALALAAAGATVVAAARTLGRVDGEPPERNTLNEVVQAAGTLAGRVYAHVCDVEQESDVVGLVGQTASNFGRVDVLVNDAAIMKRFDPLATSGEDWERVMRVNLRGPYIAMREAAPHMIRQRAGSIINITAGAANTPGRVTGPTALRRTRRARRRSTASRSSWPRSYASTASP